MTRRGRIAATAVWLVCGGCGGGGGGGSDAGTDNGVFRCDLQDHACPEGQRCTREQECVEAEPLRIVTDTLPDGRVDFGYSQQLEAEGGLPPYGWAIARADPALDFLAISPRGKLEGSSRQVVTDASITVEVTDDGYGGGETASATFILSFHLCRDGDTELCYAPRDGACHQGSRTCTDGQMGPCEPGPNLSADRMHCGPSCEECDRSVSDACSQGLCACGDGPVCTGANRCCEGTCIDVDDNVEHCGGCNRDCRQMIAHASGADVFCSGGECDYTGSCDRGWLDCDGARDNGCELPVGKTFCGDCDLDCTEQVSHVPSSSITCNDTGDDFVCDYNGACLDDFGDCDAARTNGCETRFTEVENCGGCGVDCTQDAVGHLCLTPDPADPYAHQCGCRYDGATGQAEGCDQGQICCDYVCREAATDPAHCGVCRAACTAGDCVDGACACKTDADCPAPSGATGCGGTRCVCPHAGSGEAACQPGWYCCDGEAGGSGGPDEEPDTGCCPKLCGQNDADAPCTQ